MRLWIVTNARLHRDGRLAASALQNLQTAHALAALGHEVLLWVAELDGALDALLRDRLGLEPSSGLQALVFRPRGPRGEKKTPFASWAARAWNLTRARRAMGDWPDAIVTRSPRVLLDLAGRGGEFSGRGGLPAACRLVLEFQYPEWALLWRGWRHRRPEASFAECRRRLGELDAIEALGARTAHGVLYAAQSHPHLLRRYDCAGKPAQWLPSGCQPPDTADASTGEPVYDFGYLGSIAPENGLETLIDAMARLGRGRLLIQGGGDAGVVEALRRKAESLKVDATFAPAVDYREVRRAMRQCAAGIVPLSRRFGCEKRQYASPLKLIEWMAAGVPVVASDVPSVGQSVANEREALLVAPDDPDALAAALGRLYDDATLRRDLSAAALELAKRTTQDDRAKTIARFCERLQATGREAARR
jgi:glycosyltransferase involved in cell wall biosynthesis